MDKLAFLEMQIEQMHMLDLMQKQARQVYVETAEDKAKFTEQYARQKLHGLGLGAVAGTVVGAGAGALLGKGKDRLPAAIVGAIAGAPIGGFAGMIAGAARKTPYEKSERHTKVMRRPDAHFTRGWLTGMRKVKPEYLKKKAQYAEGNISERPWVFPLVGAGLGALTGGIAGAAGTKPGKSKLRRALLGAGIGAAGGGLGAMVLRSAITNEGRESLLSGSSNRAPIVSGLAGLGVGALGGAAAGYGSGKDEKAKTRRAVKGAIIGGGVGGLLGLAGGRAASLAGSKLHADVEEANRAIGEALGGRRGGFPLSPFGPRRAVPRELFPGTPPSDELHYV